MFDFIKRLFSKKKQCTCEKCNCNDVVCNVNDCENVVEQKSEVQELTEALAEFNNNDTIKNTNDFIKKYQFKNNKDLTEFVIENNINKIELSAFYNCTSLNKLIVDTDHVPQLERNAFVYKNEDNKIAVLPKLKIYVNKDLLNDFKSDKAWAKYSDIIKPINNKIK